jgi:hypothetical protein
MYIYIYIDIKSKYPYRISPTWVSIRKLARPWLYTAPRVWGLVHVRMCVSMQACMRDCISMSIWKFVRPLLCIIIILHCVLVHTYAYLCVCQDMSLRQENMHICHKEGFIYIYIYTYYIHTHIHATYTWVILQKLSSFVTFPLTSPEMACNAFVRTSVSSDLYSICMYVYVCVCVCARARVYIHTWHNM